MKIKQFKTYSSTNIGLSKFIARIGWLMDLKKKI